MDKPEAKFAVACSGDDLRIVKDFSAAFRPQISLMSARKTDRIPHESRDVSSSSR